MILYTHQRISKGSHRAMQSNFKVKGNPKKGLVCKMCSSASPTTCPSSHYPPLHYLQPCPLHQPPAQAPPPTPVVNPTFASSDPGLAAQQRRRCASPSRVDAALLSCGRVPACRS